VEVKLFSLLSGCGCLTAVRSTRRTLRRAAVGCRTSLPDDGAPLVAAGDFLGVFGVKFLAGWSHGLAHLLLLQSLFGRLLSLGFGEFR